MTTRSNLSPLKATRAYCLWCCNGSATEVRLCPSVSCPLHPMRFGRNTENERLAEDQTFVLPEERPATREELGDMSTLALIRRRCIDCSGGSLAEVRRCGISECALHPFRMAKNPNRARAGYGYREKGRHLPENDRSRQETGAQ
jgi:hypothetical protein